MCKLIMTKVSILLISLVLCAGTGCGTTRKVGATVGKAAKTAGKATSKVAVRAGKATTKAALTAGKATSKAAVTAGRATTKAATWPIEKIREASGCNESGDQPPPKQ